MADVIAEMLNDTSKDMRSKKIFIEDIDPCEYNMYPMQEIDQYEPQCLETLWNLRERAGADTAACAHLNLWPDGSETPEPVLPAGIDRHRQRVRPGQSQDPPAAAGDHPGPVCAAGYGPRHPDAVARRHEPQQAVGSKAGAGGPLLAALPAVPDRSWPLSERCSAWPPILW